MNTKRNLRSLVLYISLLLCLPAWVGDAQANQSGASSPQNPGAVSAYISPVMSYQGRLLENGAPVTGSRQMTFSLCLLSVGGGCIWSEGPKPVAVNNGIFTTVLGDTNAFDLAEIDQMHQELWLQISVGGTTLDRQLLMGAPYAFSLAPGANVLGNQSAGVPVVEVYNNGSGHGLLAASTGSGLDGAALKAAEVGANGIALWADADSTDTTIVSINQGVGPLFKGFGNNGGDYDFIVKNDGSVAQHPSARGLVKAGVNTWCGSSGSSIIKSFNNVGGTITISNGVSAGSCNIDMDFTVADHYWVAVPVGTGAAYVSCIESSPSDILWCARFGSDGLSSAGEIMVLFY